MTSKTRWSAQLVVVMLCALTLKFFYSTASPDELRWILAPTTKLVELLSGRTFNFEAHAGYMSSDHSFLIAASCAGVNFLLTAFLMLMLKRLWQCRFEGIGWSFFPIAAAIAYLTTIITNTVRICVALQMQGWPSDVAGLDHNEIHRIEGILVYFGFLLLLYWLTEPEGLEGWLKRSSFPLGIYYSTTVGMPLLNGAYRQGSKFWVHTAFVVILPFTLIVGLSLMKWFQSAVKLKHAKSRPVQS